MPNPPVRRPPVPSPRLLADGLSAALLAWFDAHGRPLAIRALRDPWAILVTEVMSQQTQIGRVEERVPAFLDAFPRPADLAATSTTDLLRAWAGLGYNRRAVALREAAHTVVERHDGRVPGDLADLRALPGVGPYTARAVAARAFGLPVAALDVNVRRVMRRVLPSAALDAGRPRSDLQAAADLLVDARRPGAWNDAVMDLAASLCGPREPACAACPIRSWCRTGTAGATGEQGPHRLVAEGRPSRTGEAIPFAHTRRWLRGRLVAELRDAEAGSWLALDGSRGTHPARAVAETLRDLEREGLVELDPERGARLR